MTTAIVHRNSRQDAIIYSSQGVTYFLKRDKEIARNVEDGPEGAFGFAGSDVIEEATVTSVVTEKLTPVCNDAGQQLRFALITRDSLQDRAMISLKIASNEPLKLATSYPNIMQQRLGAMGIRIATPYVATGGIEALLWQYPEINAAFELVQSGNSINNNHLTIVEDNIAIVSLLRVTQKRKEDD